MRIDLLHRAPPPPSIFYMVLHHPSTLRKRVVVEQFQRSTCSTLCSTSKGTGGADRMGGQSGHLPESPVSRWPEPPRRSARRINQHRHQPDREGELTPLDSVAWSAPVDCALCRITHFPKPPRFSTRSINRPEHDCPA